LDSLYDGAHRALQEDFGTTRLADFLDKHHVHHALDEQDRAFIASRDMFFLSTVDAGGNPTVSYKGGPTGVVRVLSETTIAFPGYDGNGMFLSMGNIAGQGKIGMLFIDFETPHRLRLQGTARVVKDDPLVASFPEAQYIVRVEVESVWVNCPRYIHRYQKVEESRYVPKAGQETPLAQWKRLDFVQPVIADEDRARVAKEGELDLGAYGELVAHGQG